MDLAHAGLLRATVRHRGAADSPPSPDTGTLRGDPFDLFRNEMMMTLKPVPDHVLRQIVDDIFIPLVTTGQPTR